MQNIKKIISIKWLEFSVLRRMSLIGLLPIVAIPKPRQGKDPIGRFSRQQICTGENWHIFLTHISIYLSFSALDLGHSSGQRMLCKPGCCANYANQRSGPRDSNSMARDKGGLF